MIPENRIPTHPGVILSQEFLMPLGVSQVALLVSVAFGLALLVREARARQQVVALGNPDVGAARLALPGAQREVERIKAEKEAAENAVFERLTHDVMKIVELGVCSLADS